MLAVPEPAKVKPMDANKGCAVLMPLVIVSVGEPENWMVTAAVV